LAEPGGLSPRYVLFTTVTPVISETQSVICVDDEAGARGFVPV